jgi:Asp-tRNA(Asn)/Glu-tRNA(Gln) amidotransferase A subunit family amidase
MNSTARTLFALVLCLLLNTAAHPQTRPHAKARTFNVTEASIAQTQQAIRTGRTTCRAIVEQYLARIRAYDQQPLQDASSGPDHLRLNAIVTLNPQALADADRCDRDFRRTHTLPPLGGIAVLIKDNYDTTGLQTAGGSLAMKGFKPTKDATMVAKLRTAGAIVIAKTNMAEWAFSPYLTASSIAGITRNPYDLTRVPAGSSGGTGAGVAASLGQSGLGTDTGNSIRGPSSHNDLVGIRPTLGLTSRAGIIPLFAHNDVGGPMARSVADAAALLTVVAGADPADPLTALDADRPHVDYSKSLDRHGLRGARIGVYRPYIDTPTTDPEIKALTEQALKELAAEGATLVDPFTIPNEAALEKDLWCGDFEADLNHYLDQHPTAPYHSLKSIVDSGLYLPYIADEITGAIAPPKPNPDGTRDRRTPCPDVYHDAPKIAFRNALTAAIARDHLDAIVYPTWSNAPRKVGDTTSPAGDNSQVLSPQTGFPAITVPMGFTHGTLPAGLTFLGPDVFTEQQLIRYAYDYEQTTHHRKPPPLFPTLR